MSNIVFVVNHLGIRGTEVCVFDYMKGCRDILGHTPYILYPADGDMTAYEKFRKEFWPNMTSYTSPEHLKQLVDGLAIYVVYWIKAGFNDGKLIPGVKNVVHTVFNLNQPHSEKYAYVSKWLSEQNGNAPYVPHIVSMPEPSGDYKDFLGIPKDALVFGRYGGYDQFDVEYLEEVVKWVSCSNPNIYFLFMNTKPFSFIHPNVIHLGATTDVDEKRGFMDTIDCFLHGRKEGESFGLAVCEALACNKPVITNIECRDRHHIQLMGDKGFYYSSANELATILSHFKKPTYDYRQLVEQFSPQNVMPIFEEVFLK
jgi:glycosyltransferase involved in cell wall biosynthesis